MADSGENLKVVVIIFVVTTMVCLAASVLLYTELRKQYETVDSAEARVEEINKKFEKQLRRADMFAERCLGERDGTPDGLDETFVPDEDFKPVVLTEETDGTPESLIDLVRKLRNKVTSLKEDSEVLRGELEDKSRAYETKEEELDSVRRIKEEEIARLREELGNERNSSGDTIRDLEEERAALREETRTNRIKLAKAGKARKQAVAELQVEVENLKRRISDIEISPGPLTVSFEFDGSILAANSRYKTVTLDLGAIDGVRPGFVFDIYPPGRGREENLKGKVEISETHRNVSTARILSETITNPLMVGDQVYNPLYNRHKREIFTLVGEFDAPYTIEWVTGLIEEHGGIPSREVSNKTDYVILGTTYERSEGYEKAKQVGMEVLRVQSLDKFFGI